VVSQNAVTPKNCTPTHQPFTRSRRQFGGWLWEAGLGWVCGLFDRGPALPGLPGVHILKKQHASSGSIIRPEILSKSREISALEQSEVFAVMRLRGVRRFGSRGWPLLEQEWDISF